MVPVDSTELLTQLMLDNIPVKMMSGILPCWSCCCWDCCCKRAANCSGAIWVGAVDDWLGCCCGWPGCCVCWGDEGLCWDVVGLVGWLVLIPELDWGEEEKEYWGGDLNSWLSLMPSMLAWLNWRFDNCPMFDIYTPSVVTAAFWFSCNCWNYKYSIQKSKWWT